MAGESKRTRDHEKIRRWVEARGGFPATVKKTATDVKVGPLRVDYPGYRGEHSLKRITWDEFFDKFDREDLVFLYQETTRTGRTSRFSKFLQGKSGDKARSAGKAIARTPSHSGMHAPAWPRQSIAARGAKSRQPGVFEKNMEVM